MRKLLFLLFLAAALPLSAHAADASCPDISGVYLTENDQVNFEQYGCERLVRQSAARLNHGDPVYAVTRYFQLDGTPFLFDGKRGEAAKLVRDVFEFTFNFAGGHRLVVPHGFCKTPKMTVAKKSERKLEVHYVAEDCEDGFSGEVIGEWTRISN